MTFIRGALRTPGGVLSLLCLTTFVVLAVVAPIIWGDAAALQNPAASRQGMSAEHWLGTDDLGRDVFARILVATRLSLTQPLIAVGIGASIGVGIGALAQSLPLGIRRVLVGLNEFLMVFPGLLLAFVAAAIVGPGAGGAIVAISLSLIPVFFRLSYTLVGGIVTREFVSAARLLGLGPWTIVRRHLLPNIAAPLIVHIMVTLAIALVSFAGLSFLGLGVQIPSFDWGSLITDGLSRIYTDPLISLAPAVPLILVGLSLGALGDVLSKISQGRGAGGRAGDRDGVDGAAEAREAALHLRENAERHAFVDDPLLAVRGLRVSHFSRSAQRRVEVVHSLNFDIGKGEIVGVVGESGSGKSQTALALANLIEQPGRVEAESLTFAGDRLPTEDRAALSKLLRARIGMVFQNPLQSLNPAIRIGEQLIEASVSQGASRREARLRAIGLLERVRMVDPERCMRSYPSQLSGGMRQRVMIAMSLMTSPDLLIADEPTTALDVTVQQEILGLLQQIRDDRGTSILLISHDLAVVSEICDRVMVMRNGNLVEILPVEHMGDARDPYTRSLIACTPDLTTPRDQPLRTVEDLIEMELLRAGADEPVKEMGR